MPAPLPLSEKVDAVRRVSALMTAGKAMRAACREAGVSVSSYEGWRDKFKAGGEAGLMPDYSKCGRRAKWEVDETEAKALRGLCLIFDSQTFAIEEFVKHPDCRPETREAIQAEIDEAKRAHRYCRWPVSLRRAVATSVDDRAKMRGPKHFEAISFAPRKGLFFTDEKGRRVSLFPHTAWVMDDYSTNEPYIVETEEGAERTCRQTLAAMDVASDGWLGVEMIGRERDAYRGEDILRFMLRCIDGQGTMPRYLLLERGRWDSIAVHGLDLGTSREKGGLGPKFEGRCWGGLDHLFTIIHGFSSRHKACLESSFNLLQRALAHSGREIGRHAGEFEAATKAMLAVNAGRRDARAQGFLTIEEAREAHWRAMQYLNARGKHRAATGLVEVPNDLLAMWDAELDGRRLPDTERWRFLPVKRFATVRQGHIDMSVSPYKQSFRFQINGTASGVYLPHGYRVLVAFDPTLPAMGARVCNGEDGSLNREHLPIGEFMMTAPHAEDVGQFDLRVGGYADSSKRRASTAASTAFASINPFRRGLAVDARHDGQGNATVARRGAKRASDGIAVTGVTADVVKGEGSRAGCPEDSQAGSLCHGRRGVSAEEMAAREREAEEHLAVY